MKFHLQLLISLSHFKYIYQYLSDSRYSILNTKQIKQFKVVKLYTVTILLLYYYY